MVMVGVLFWEYKFNPTRIILSTFVGMLIGTSVVLWELFRYKRRAMEDVFSISYLSSTMTTVFLMLNAFIRRIDWFIPLFSVFLGYQLSCFVCLVIIERRINKRFRWIDFYPK